MSRAELDASLRGARFNELTARDNSLMDGGSMLVFVEDAALVASCIATLAFC